MDRCITVDFWIIKVHTSILPFAFGSSNSILSFEITLESSHIWILKHHFSTYAPLDHRRLHQRSSKYIRSFETLMIQWRLIATFFSIEVEGGRSWHPSDEGKNGYKIFRQTHICYFRDKCVVLHVITNLIQYNMQYMPCYSAILVQETLFLTHKSPRSSKKCVNRDKS